MGHRVGGRIDVKPPKIRSTVAHDVLPAQWTDLDPEILPEERLLFDLAKINPSDPDVAHAVTLASGGRFSWTNTWNPATRPSGHRALATNVPVRPTPAPAVSRE